MPINKTLLSKDQIKNLTVDWGTIQGSISNQTDLLALLNTKSDIDHNHDNLYLPINGTAADAAMLDGKLPSYYTTAANITYDNSISGLAATNMQSVVDEIITILPASGEEPEFTIREIIKNTSGTLTTSDVMGTFINNLGQNGNIELTLPEATEGLSFVVMMGSSSPYQFKLIANANDRIYLQTQHSIYGGFVGLTSTNKCDTAIVNTFKTGDKYEWLVLPFLGTWTINTGTLGKIDVTITPLSVARSDLAATTIGNYALFGGGCGYDNVYSNRVDAYDTSLTRTTPTPLSVARYRLAATTVGNYALFGGGYSPASNVVDAYDTSLTRTTPTTLSVARYNLAATTVGNYALFGGGTTGSKYNVSNVVDAYDTSLTRTTPTTLSVARYYLAATTIGNYALFGGGCGYDNVYSNRVDAYDTSLTRTTPTPLSAARGYLASTTVGNYALFGGGGNVVDAYNTSLTRTIPTPLSVARNALAATTVGNFALFGDGSSSNVVDAYDTSLTRTTPTALSVARSNLAATTVGNYALFGGGSSNVVDAYYVF